MWGTSAESPRVVRGYVAPGRQGTFQVLQLMRQLVAEGSRDPLVRQAAVEILQRANVPPGDYSGEVGALFDFVQHGVRFTRDVWDVETLQAAEYTLRTRAGDCDDMVVLLCAMLRAVGNPAQLAFRVIGTNPQRPRAFNHVYVVAQVDGRAVSLDPIVDEPAGWEYPGPFTVGEVPV